MLIGNQYADNKIYRGIRHYDGLPLTSEDIHEFSDTLYMKTAYIMNNIIGSGLLNTPTVSIDSSGIRLNEPAVVLIDGDIALIQSDANVPLVNKIRLRNLGADKGVVCVVGWYQRILARSTLRNYGGVHNSSLPNDLLHEDLQVQVSTRYQFRWSVVLQSEESIRSGNLSFVLQDRDEDGNVLSSNSYLVTTNKKSGNIFIADKPEQMPYALSDLYIIPIMNYEYSSLSDSIMSADSYEPTTPKGSSKLVNSEEEPEGEYPEGTIWYNPVTREFKTYVVGVGFVSSASTMGFLQYQSIYEFPNDVTTPQNIVVPVNISELEESDLLQVVYEGVTLVAGEHYTANYSNQTITLLGFTVSRGDKIAFTATKLVEANDITNITATFTTHMSQTGSSTVKAHVKLSDTIDSNPHANSGVAATPRAVAESKIMVDSITGTRYKFGVENGLLYIEEV